VLPFGEVIFVGLDLSLDIYIYIYIYMFFILDKVFYLGSYSLKFLAIDLNICKKF
jgi:hypothetical protein